MIRLAILLVGARSVRRQWLLLPAIGALWIMLGVLLIADVSDGVLSVTIDTLGVLLLVEGSAGLIGAFASTSRTRAALIGRAIAFIVFGLLVLDVPFDHGISDSVLFGLAFLVDGSVRMASAAVVRFERWRLAIFAGLIELALAALIIASWPLPNRYTIPFCVGIALLASGSTLVRLGLQLRRLPPGASITDLPLFFSRPWHIRGELPPEREARFDQPEPMTLYVWTPAGSIADPQRRLLIDRYIAAVDRKGVISTGHSALELKPDVYISHYPAVEIDHSPDDFTRLLRAGRENDVPGRWNPTHENEVTEWCEADQKVVFRRFDADALRAFWAIYGQDNTYNLTSRSCSTVTALAIESALEGILGQRRPWLTFFLLLIDPNLWLAAILRRRGVTMAWTPGLVLDYARVLKSVVERQDRRWFARLAQRIRGDRATGARPAP